MLSCGLVTNSNCYIDLQVSLCFLLTSLKRTYDHFIIKTKAECENIGKITLGFNSKESKNSEATGSDELCHWLATVTKTSDSFHPTKFNI